MFSGPDGVLAIYQRSKKPRDHLWNAWVCRPVAAVLVYLLRATPITPNQITFLSLFTSLAGNAALLLVGGAAGPLLAALLVELAFILDCVDGQLARIRGTASPVGGYLDFFMDEVKAVALVAAVAGHLAQRAHGAESGPLGASALQWMALGLAGAVLVATGVSLTTFMRRAEYVTYVQRRRGQPVVPPPSDPGEVAHVAPPPRRSLVGRLVGMAEWGGRAVVHYPQWLWIPALLDRMEWFLVPYLCAHALYLGRSGLMVLWNLGGSGGDAARAS